MSAAAAVAPGSSPDVETVPAIAISMSWPQFVRPCALAALIAAVTMVLELVVPLIAILGAGFLAVAFYRRGTPSAAMDAKGGARMGALCGFFTFGFTAILGSIKVILLHMGGEIRQKMLDIVQQTAARYPDPQAQPTWDFFRSPAGLVFLLVMLLVFSFFVFLVLGILGGTLGGVALGRRDKNSP
jgi:hypothetical protein